MTRIAGLDPAVLRAELSRHLADLRRAWADSAQTRALVYLVVGVAAAVVLMAILIDVARYLDLHSRKLGRLSLTRDRSVPELVMDGLALTAAYLNLSLFRQSRLRSYLFLAGILCFVALDDFFSFHENIGLFLVEQFAIPDRGALKGQSLAELFVFAGFGLAALLGLLWVARALRPADVVVFALYGALFGLLAFFAVGTDLIHTLVSNSILHRLLGWLEDGGEIMAVSLMTALAILQWRGKRLA